MPAPAKRYAVKFKDGHIEYVTAPNEKMARIEAARLFARRRRENPAAPSVASVERSREQ